MFTNNNLLNIKAPSIETMTKVMTQTKIGREEKIDQEVALEREENTDQPRRVINTIAKGLQVKDVPLRQGRSTWAMFDS